MAQSEDAAVVEAPVETFSSRRPTARIVVREHSRTVARTCMVVEDDPAMRTTLAALLEELGLFDQILLARNGSEALELHSREGGEPGGDSAVDMVLCDLHMPGGLDGIEFLRRFKADPKNEDTPVIMLTSEDGVSTKVRALEGGASDYLTKPTHPAELSARVRVHLKVKLLQDSLKQSNRQLRKLAVTDSLTGVYIRRYFFEQLERELSRATRYSYAVSVLMIDVDNFKAVNDTYGHLTGDRVLTGVAEALRDNLRRHDVLARYGGEEFAVLLPHTDRTAAVGAAEKLRRIVRERVSLGDPPQSVTVSVGVATHIGDPALEIAQDILKRADEALYDAKRSGRDRVSVEPE